MRERAIEGGGGVWVHVCACVFMCVHVFFCESESESECECMTCVHACKCVRVQQVSSRLLTVPRVQFDSVLW